MEQSPSCDACEFEPVQPNAQFMFTQVEQCRECGALHRADSSGESAIPRFEKELLEE